MQAEFQVSNRLKIVLEGAGQKELFKEMASVSEVFSHNQCGACKSPDIRFVVRTATKGNKKYDYYEIHCTKCRARLSFGQHNENGTLFPHRKDSENNFLPNNGWVKFEGNKQEEKGA